MFASAFGFPCSEAFGNLPKLVDPFPHLKLVALFRSFWVPFNASDELFPTVINLNLAWVNCTECVIVDTPVGFYLD